MSITAPPGFPSPIHPSSGRGARGRSGELGTYYEKQRSREAGESIGDGFHAHYLRVKAWESACEEALLAPGVTSPGVATPASVSMAPLGSCPAKPTPLPRPDPCPPLRPLSTFGLPGRGGRAPPFPPRPSASWYHSS